jgi:hypothetical protein
MLDEVIAIVRHTGALEFSRHAAAQEAQRAIASANFAGRAACKLFDTIGRSAFGPRQLTLDRCLA